MKILRNMSSRSNVFKAVFLFVAFLCAPLLFVQPAGAAGAVAEDGGVPSDYIIGAEDVLEVLIWKNSDLSKTVIVRPDGKISLPLIGDVQAAGSTPTQLRDAIVVKLKKYQDTVVASVIVAEVNSYRIYIIGEVSTPGSYFLKTNTTLLQALSMAGGFTQFASKNKIMLVRKNAVTGEDEKIRVRFDDLVYEDDPEGDMMLRPGDTIFVP